MSKLLKQITRTIILFCLVKQSVYEQDPAVFKFLHESLNPPILIVNQLYGDRALTVYGTHKPITQIFPANLGKVTPELLPFQILRSYYRPSDQGIWFEWTLEKVIVDSLLNENVNIDESVRLSKSFMSNNSLSENKVYLIASGSEIHGTRVLRETDMLMELTKVPDNMRYFNLMKDDTLCLTVGEYHEARDSYGLLFKPCDMSPSQNFTFVSLMKAVCILGFDNICDNTEGAIAKAEDIAKSRIEILI
ncbi:hypothetical protein EDEG_03859 [Edhazardia aedis USNM 41457]|uniref:Uncharacterized protein n=1 Tax=Edhazardia aedis (strain USNM 41457) TaxID=1003232 RepID=J9D198_EDHAE|nr:hypothetical protein EDEG_03859 [Edhazardia aedis USNM 41457]|eukprot:EJW01601.1 hypothetical protein EDEG_03859 [Edhazardia aedis USNM 41457]